MSVCLGFEGLRGDIRGADAMLFHKSQRGSLASSSAVRSIPGEENSAEAAPKF